MLNLAFLRELPSLAHVLEERAAAHPGREAFSEAGGRLSYGELRAEANRIAGLLSGAGVRPGDHVVLLLPAGLAFVRCFWGIQRAGAVACALNPYAPVPASVRRAAAARPALVIHDPSVVPGFAGQAGTLRCLSVAELDAPAAPGPLGGALDDLAYLQTTSGTSGEARIAMIRQSNVLELLWSMVQAIILVESDCYVAWVPPWHDLGMVRFVIGTVFYGSRCVIVPPAVHTIPLWLETVARERATITGAPDFAWRIAARLGKPGLDLSSLRYAVNGGEPVRMSTVRAFEEKYGLSNVIRPGYGLAEATLGVAFTRELDRAATDDRGNVSCGLPTPGIELRIDDEDGSGTGEIVVRGPTVFAGYFEAPESTAEVLRDGWLYTGDTGRLDAQGNLYILGRKRAMLKRGGAIHAPRELEEAAHEVPGVKIAAAVGLPPGEAKATEEIVVAVEIEEGAGPVESVAGRISAAVREETGFPPDRVMVLAPRSILRTWNGKVRHDALRQELLSGALKARGGVLFSG